MKAFKKVSLIMVVVILATISMIMLAGCTVKLNADQAWTTLDSAISNSVVQNNYYVKNIKYTEGATHDIRLNVKADNSKTDVEDSMVRFTITTTRGIGSTEEVLDNLYAPMLASSVKKPDKAAISDYKNYIIKYDSKKKTAIRSVATLDSVLASDEIKSFTISNLLLELNSLEKSNVTINEATKYGVTTTIPFTVTKEGHKYNGTKIVVNILYNKIGSVLINDAAGKKVDEFFITYEGPKIAPPRYDGKYYDISITE